MKVRVSISDNIRHAAGIVLALLVVALFPASCTSDDEKSSEVHKKIGSENLYLEFNKWTYSQMNFYYLWRDEMPDSLECDYELDPVSFFRSLLSPNDRFSYIDNNTSYNPPGEEFSYAYPSYEQFTRSIFDQSTVLLDSIYTINNVRIGYLCYLEFGDEADLLPAMEKFYRAEIDELILDLRYNPGGYVSTCKYLSNSIVSERAYNDIFQQCTYNEVYSRLLESKSGSRFSVNNYITPDNGKGVLSTPLYGLNLDRVFVLTSKGSASASEAAIIGMRPFMDVVLIGEKTFGKGVGSWTISDRKYKYQLQPITMRYHNALMESTPDDGIDVDYEVPGGYYTPKQNIGKIGEPLLAKALSLINAGMSDNTNQQ